MVGGRLVDWLEGYRLSWELHLAGPEGQINLETLDFQNWDFLFFAAVLIGLYSIHRLGLVQETGKVPDKITMKQVISEVKREVRDLSSIGGLSTMIAFPFSFAKRIIRRDPPPKS